MLYNNHNLAVAKFAAKDGIRQEIAGVLFTKEKTAATDSICLLEVSTDTALKVKDYPKVQSASAMRGFKPFIVLAEWMNKIKLPSHRFLPALNSVAVKHIADSKVDFLISEEGTTAQILSIPRVSGKYPDYEKIFPKSKPKAHFMINGVKMAELLKVMAALPPLKGVEVFYYGKNKPIELRAHSDTQKSRGLIMLMKED